MIAAHADWSAHPGKRWACVAARAPRGWMAAVPRLVGDPARLLPSLMAGGAPVALGLDLPLGLPRAFAAGRAEPDFPAFLAARLPEEPFFQVADSLESVSLARPFYPMRGVRGMRRAAHAAALGFAGPAALSRACDRATADRPAGAPLFWTLGANQTGKAAITAWRDWLGPALRAGAPIALWPFAGPLAGLLAPGRAVLAEVYPAEALRQLGLRLAGSKRDTAARRDLAGPLEAVMARLGVRPDADLAEAIAEGFGTDAAGEDRLDCVLGLLNLVAVLDGARPDHIPADPWIRRWEGWVLGQAGPPAAP